MDAPPSDLVRDAAITAGKFAASAGPTAYGLLTLNSLALMVGILSSLVIITHTVLKIWWGFQDRKAGRATQ